MRIALRELRRRPGRFTPALVAMTLLVVLLVVLGGFLDGLERSQTGVLRAQGDRLLVLAEDAELAPRRSRLPAGTADAVRAVDGVTEVGGLSQVATTAGADGEILDVVLVGYELATDRLPTPPAPGRAVIDQRLADQLGLAAGDRLAVGPGEEPLAVTAVVDDLSAGAPTVWVAAGAWTDLARAADPTGSPTTQALVVAGDVTPDDLAGVSGVEAATVADVIAADEVVSTQSGTFQGILGVTFVVTLLVVALFFILLTIERVGLYAVLKAVGGRSRDLLAGLALQATAVAVVAVAAGVAVSIGLLAFVPPDLPIIVLPSRLAVLAAATVVTAVLGALGTLRRILRIDPADAIG
jgi:putative ABC transport system permease protein